MVSSYQQVIAQLGIDIELFLQRLEAGLYKKLLSQRDKEIICLFLLGYRRKQIAEKVNLCDAEVGNQLNANIYPRIADLMQVEQSEIANNWVLILNFLLNPAHGYRLNPATQLNSDNFQGSFGRQMFFYSPDQRIVQLQIKGTQRYQQGLYYQALLFFVKAWNEEQKIYGRGNPEICIYLNNCLIEYQKPFLEKHNIPIYTLAVVVPFHHNQGRVAAEILRGIAQIQSQVNFQNFDIPSLEMEFCQSAESDVGQNGKSDQAEQPKITGSNIFSVFGNTGPITSSKLALQIMVVNDPNHVYDPYNQTAERLASLAPQLNLSAVIGHYSSEMTQTALKFYSEKGIVLINASSTSDDLSELDETMGFFRLTTHDRVSAASLIHYLATSSSGSGIKKAIKQVAIIYNENSGYSCSYRAAVKASLENHQNQLELQSEFGRLGGEFDEIQTYLTQIQQTGVDIVILIPDGGIEPNSLHNAGLISRLNLKNCMIVGPATFYQQNVLHWMYERSQRESNIAQNQLLACIPWHWYSEENGCNSPNALARYFCQLGSQLWGRANVTWRSATAFDAVLIILKTLEHQQENESLLVQMRRFFKVKNKAVKGVTGIVKFQENGNRIAPPAEIVAVQEVLEPQQEDGQIHAGTSVEIKKRWAWVHLRSMSKPE
ncbi:MAG: amino acid ABC transporter substrate-binding protein [Elainella sp. C42_A2020_010]|nr:amino acid ABC transporter substrate-binding protein [Elainella sp. C42_A2020_010]